MILFIAWRNLWRNPARSFLSAMALVSGLFFINFYIGISEGMRLQMIHQATTSATGQIQVHRQLFIDDQDFYALLPQQSLATLEDQLVDAKVTPRLYAAGLASTQTLSVGAILKAIDFDRERRVSNLEQRLHHGELRFDLHRDTGRYQLVVGRFLAERLQLEIGDELILLSQAADGSLANDIFTLAGVLGPIDPGFDRSGVLMDIQVWREFIRLDEGFHEIAINFPEGSELIQTTQLVDETLNTVRAGDTDYEDNGAIIVRHWRELIPVIANMMDISRFFVWIIGLIVILLASSTILTSTMMAIHERLHEFGVLMALGMRGTNLMSMIVAEAFVLSLIACLGGNLISWIVFQGPLEQGLDFSALMPEGFDWGGIVFDPIFRIDLSLTNALLTTALVCVVAVGVSIFPAWRITRLRPVDALG